MNSGYNYIWMHPCRTEHDTHRAPTSYPHLHFTTETPFSSSPSVHCPIAAQSSTSLPKEWEVSTRAGTAMWQFGWRWHLPRSFSIDVCVPPSLLHKSFLTYLDTRTALRYISVFQLIMQYADERPSYKAA